MFCVFLLFAFLHKDFSFQSSSHHFHYAKGYNSSIMNVFSLQLLLHNFTFSSSIYFPLWTYSCLIAGGLCCFLISWFLKDLQLCTFLVWHLLGKRELLTLSLTWKDSWVELLLRIICFYLLLLSQRIDFSYYFCVVSPNPSQ